MSTILLRTIAFAAGAFALLVGIWGLVSPGDMESPAEITESVRWAAAGILSAAISALSATLLHLDRRTP